MSAGGSVRKRSITLRGHPTSVSLEDEFWAELQRMAAKTGISVAALVARIDGERATANLSSALRLAVLHDLKSQLAATAGTLSEP